MTKQDMKLIGAESRRRLLLGAGLAGAAAMAFPREARAAYQPGAFTSQRGFALAAPNPQLPIITPEMCGCVGNYTVDDTDNFQAFLNALVAEGAQGVIPAGKTYRVSSSPGTPGLTLTRPVSIMGYGAVPGMIVNAGTGICFYIGSSTAIQQFSLVNFQLAGIAGSLDVLVMENCSRGRVQIYVPSAAGAAINLKGSLLNDLNGCDVSNNIPFVVPTAPARAAPTYGFVWDTSSLSGGPESSNSNYGGIIAEGCTNGEGAGWKFINGNGNNHCGTSEGCNVGIALDANALTQGNWLGPVDLEVNGTAQITGRQEGNFILCDTATTGNTAPYQLRGGFGTKLPSSPIVPIPCPFYVFGGYQTTGFSTGINIFQIGEDAAAGDDLVQTVFGNGSGKRWNIGPAPGGNFAPAFCIDDRGFFGTGGQILPAVGLHNKGALASTPVALQTITDVTNTISANSMFKEISSNNGGTYILTSTPSIAAGVDGQVMCLTNTGLGGGAGGVTLQNHGTLSGSGLSLVGTTITLDPLASVWLRYSAALGWWVQTTPVLQGT